MFMHFIRLGLSVFMMLTAFIALWAAPGHGGEELEGGLGIGGALVATLMPEGRPGEPLAGGAIAGKSLTAAKRCRDDLLGRDEEKDAGWIEDCVQLISRFEGAGRGKIVIVKMKTDAGGRQYFEPSEVIINRGDTIRWVSESGGHTSDAYPDRIPEDTMPWSLPLNSGLRADFSRTFFIPGIYSYRCRLHEASGMSGVVTVMRGPDTVRDPGLTRHTDSYP
jgi:plastocyanin